MPLKAVNSRSLMGTCLPSGSSRPALPCQGLSHRKCPTSRISPYQCNASIGNRDHAVEDVAPSIASTHNATQPFHMVRRRSMAFAAAMAVAAAAAARYPGAAPAATATVAAPDVTGSQFAGGGGPGCCTPRQMPATPSTRRKAATGVIPAFDVALDKGLGDIDFQPLTIPSEAPIGMVTSPGTLDLARKHFLLGLKLLHVFWFDVAAQQFQYAQQLVPGFAMAYWGEAMTYKQPLWQVEDAAAANQVLAMMEDRCDLDTLTPRELSYITAARTYFRQGATLQEREQGYSVAMEAIMDASPDADASAFYGLSLLGMATSAQRYLNPDEVKSTLARARDHLDTCCTRWPRHAGSLHYCVHAYDYPDLEVAARGREPGLRLAEVAYRSCHAVHMVTHIALDFGEWTLVADANNKAVRAGDMYCNQYKLGKDCDADNRYHALEWEHYGLLMQGRVREASALLSRAQDVANSLSYNKYYANWVARMYAHQVFNTQDWLRRSDVGRIPAPGMLSTFDRDIRQLPPVLDGSPADDFWLSFSEAMALLAKTYQVCRSSDAWTPLHKVVRNSTHDARAKADVEACLDEAEDRLAAIKARLQLRGTSAYLERVMDTTVLQVEALRQVLRCRSGPAAGASCDTWRPALDAMLQSERTNPKGPDAPSIVVADAREFYATLLNFMGADPFFAAQLFTESLTELPNRLGCILGLARAQASLGTPEAQQAARHTYQRLLDQCARGDSNWGGIREAKEYLRA